MKKKKKTSTELKKGAVNKSMAFPKKEKKKILWLWINLLKIFSGSKMNVLFISGRYLTSGHRTYIAKKWKSVVCAIATSAPSSKAMPPPFWTESDYRTPVKRPPNQCRTKVKQNYFYSIVIFYWNGLCWTVKYYKYNTCFQSKMAAAAVVKKTREFRLFASVLFGSVPTSNRLVSQ